MTDKFKFTKIVSFIAIVMAMIVLLSSFINPDKVTIGLYKYEKSKLWVSDEPDNSIDVFFFGDSLVYSDISPMELWNQYGWATYNLASSQVKSFEAYDMLSTVLEKQQPKIIVLEPYFLYREYSFTDEINQKLIDRIPLLKYHDAWKGIVEPGHKYEASNNHSYKGYLYHSSTKPIKSKKYMAATDKVKYPDDISLRQFDKIYNLCKEKGIELVILSAPSMKDYTYSMHNGIAKLAKEYDLEYIDLNLLTDEIGIDWQTDTYDNGDHLNHNGTVKNTAYIGKYLENKLDLPDHRGEAEYADWDETYEKYQQMIASKSEKKPKGKK